MLTQLSINGLAIIDELSIDFTKGFNVITGETGAGKSILIKALNLLLGSKTSSDVVRKGNSSAIVCGTFLISSSHAAVSCATEIGIDINVENEQCELLIRRNISSKGRSSAWINDTPVTAASLKSVGSALIDIFGQHETTKILDSTKHTHYLDQFLKTRNLPDIVKSIYKKCNRALKDLRETISVIEKSQRSQDYIKFRFEELCSLDPSQQDFDLIQESCKSAGTALAIKEKLSSSQHSIDRGATGTSLSSLVWSVSTILENVSEEGLDKYESLSQKAKEVASLLDDLSFGLDKVISDLNFDESELEENQLRLSQYQDFFRKLGVSNLSGLLEERDRLKEEIEFVETASKSVILKLSHLFELLTELSSKSKKLSAQRQKARVEVKKKVEAEFEDLAMPGATFDVKFHPIKNLAVSLQVADFGAEAEEKWSDICEILCDYSESGSEKASFMLSSNPGEASMPLEKIASGGEVSRIMLALKKSLAAGANTCILVFDEIDSGISGRVASMVGKKLQELSKNFQVVCISHLPQVAACSDSHFLVHKFGKEKRTESTITLLTKDESTREIARLLSGDKINKISLANAKSLKEKALS